MPIDNSSPTGGGSENTSDVWRPGTEQPLAEAPAAATVREKRNATCATPAPPPPSKRPRLSNDAATIQYPSSTPMPVSQTLPGAYNMEEEDTPPPLPIAPPEEEADIGHVSPSIPQPSNTAPRTIASPLHRPNFTPTPQYNLPEVPAALLSHVELTRVVARAAGPPNVGPLTTLTIRKEGSKNASDYEVEISLAASVSGLKEKLKALSGMPIREQRLTMDSLVLHPDMLISSLSDLPGPIMLIKRTSQMRIFVETINGHSHLFDCSPDDFVADIEDFVREKGLFPSSTQFHILNGGHRLYRSRTLANSGIKSGHRLRVFANIV